jgi:hypothetical protein
MLSRSSRCVRLVGQGFALVPVSRRAWRAGVLPETVELPMKESCKESDRFVQLRAKATRWLVLHLTHRIDLGEGT